MLLKKKELKKTQIASFSTSPKIPDLGTNLQSIEVSKITESLTSCLQDPVMQSTLLFVGVFVCVICWQQVGLSAIIQTLLYTIPPASVEPVRNAHKLLAISCVDLKNKGLKINVGFNPEGDIYIARYHDGKATFDLEEFLTQYVEKHSSTSKAVEKMINALDSEIPNLLLEFSNMDPDCLMTQIVIEKADYLYYIAFYPGC